MMAALTRVALHVWCAMPSLWWEAARRLTKKQRRPSNDY